MASENLQIPDILASQNQKEVTANAQTNLLDRAINGNGTFQKTITGSGSFTTTETRENPVIELTGTPGSAFTVNMPDTNRRFLTVLNSTDAVATIRNSAGGGTGQPVLEIGEATEFYYDGTNFIDIFTLVDHPYDIPTGFDTEPATSSIITSVMAVRDILFAADFAGSFGDVITNPTAQYDIDVQDDTVSIGTISVSTGGAFTFTTAGNTPKTVASGSRIDFVSPGVADGTINGLVAVLKGKVVG